MGNFFAGTLRRARGGGFFVFFPDPFNGNFSITELLT